mgnify:CR=1 FL=1
MTTLTPKHFEVIDKNKAKAYEDRQEMKRELNKFIDKCNSYELVRMYSEFKRLKREVWKRKELQKQLVLR